MKHRRDALDRFALRLPIETIDASKEIQILADAEIAVERKFLRHIAKRTARLRPRGAQIETRHPAVAARRRQKAAEHLEGGRFARPIRPEQPDYLAARNGQDRTTSV